MEDTILYTLYDVMTKKEINIHKGSLGLECKRLGFNYSALYHLNDKEKVTVLNRYTLPKNKDKIFTLIDFETGKEYDCLTNSTIFKYFDSKPDENSIKYVYELKKQRHRLSTICGHIFYLKGHKPTRVQGKTKSEHLPVVKAARDKSKLLTRIKKILRCRILSAIKRAATKKYSHTMDILGCSIEFFIKHLESQFEEGMNWENRGGKHGWQIDHIKPCDKFDLVNIEEQLKCFHYTNLQPMWRKDNRKKWYSWTEPSISLEKPAETIETPK